MRLTALPRYSRLGASSRLRILQYLPYLNDDGLTPEVMPFFDETYLLRTYDGRSTFLCAAMAYLRRVRQLRDKRGTDIIWLEKESRPWLPWRLERALVPSLAPVVVDFDDAVFHSYDHHKWRIVRRLLGRKIDRVMASAVLVMAGNAYLASRASAAGARWIEIVPTVVDLGSYFVRSAEVSNCPPRIGWIGTPSTWTEYMAPMMPYLSALASDEGARISAVGAGKAANADPFLDNLVWTEETEITRIQEMDIGIMPLTDTPWARGKCGYKLIQYMACGLPVVASPVGVNADIVEHGVNGFLVTTQAEWCNALITLLRDPDLRRRMGAEGRRKVEAKYSLQVWGPRVARMLNDVAAGQRS